MIQASFSHLEFQCVFVLFSLSAQGCKHSTMLEKGFEWLIMG